MRYSELTDAQKDLLTEVQTQIMRLREDGKTWQDIADMRGGSYHSVKANYYAGTKKIERAKKAIETEKLDSIKNMTVQQMSALCDEKAAKILQAMTKESIASATLAQKANAFGTLIQNARLLRGEATQIITHDDRRKLKDLIPAIMKEASRRGITIEGEYVTREP